MVVFYRNDKNLYHRHHNACRTPRLFSSLFLAHADVSVKENEGKKIRSSDCLVS